MSLPISARTIQNHVGRLARLIDAECRRCDVVELTVVCVMDGAFMFTADLVRALRTPSRLVFLKATSYQGTRKGATRTAPLGKLMSAQPVLIVDTIYDTGKTIAKVVRQVRRLTDQVWLAVLVEKHGKAARGAEAQADSVFVGIRLAGDPFLIGYGLDVAGRFRNLADIREYQPSAARSGTELKKEKL